MAVVVGVYKLVRVLVELWEGIFCCSVRLNIVDVLLGY